MEQSPSWEANIYSAIQEIPCRLWKPKVYYRENQSKPLVPVQSQINPIHTLMPFSLILPFTPKSSEWSFPFRFPNQILYEFLISPMCATHLHLVPRSRMRGAIPPHPQYVFMTLCLVKYRENFSFTFYQCVLHVPPISSSFIWSP
jgi:hypothetical protein